MTGRRIKLLAQIDTGRQQIEEIVAGLDRLLPGFQVRFVPAAKTQASGECETLSSLMEEARTQPGVTLWRQTPGGLQFTVFDATSDIFLVVSQKEAQAEATPPMAPEIVQRLLELELQRLHALHRNRRLETRARQLERQVEVLGLQHENSIESNYRYHDELRQARESYARQLEQEVERRTAELRKANRELEGALELKGQFLASVSHELRTPMNAVIGMTELLLQTPLQPEQREYATHVRASGEALLDLINDILDLSKIEAGKIELQPTEFGLREMVAEVMKILATRELAEDLELSWFIEPDVPDRVIGDMGRVRQILFNLGSNAIKFTQKGEVRLNVEVEPSDPRQLRFTVTDTGIGIPKSKHGVIFEAFVQADGSTTRQYGGTGLGLAICSQLVELMNGRIWVDSEPGHGSVFRFSVQLGKVPGDERHQDERTRDFAGKRILVASPYDLNRRFLAEALAHWHVPHRVADTLETALEWLESEPWDLAILDGRLVTHAGERVLTRLPNIVPTTQVILLGRPHQRRALESDPALADVIHLSKPLMHEELLSALLSVHSVDSGSQKRPGGVTPVSPGKNTPQPVMPPDCRPLRILLAEDNVINQKLAVRLLEREGHEVILAEHGGEVLELLENDDAFDVILMDIQMPVLDGIDACHEIRLRERKGLLAPQLIIAVTANAMQGDRERCIEAGMNDYLSKPIRSRSLSEALGRVPRSVLPSTEDGAIMSESTPPPFDTEAALNLVEGDEELLKEIVQLFLDHAAQLIQEAEQAIAAKDATTLQRAAHTLKGQAGQLAAAPTAEAAFQLEQMGRAGTFEGAPEAFALLRDRLAVLSATLENYVSGGVTPPPPGRPPVA